MAATLPDGQERIALQQLVDQQVALRRVAEMAAQDVPAERILDTVVVQASRLSGVGFTMLLRYEPDGSSEIMAVEGAPAEFRVGLRASADGDGSVHRVRRTGLSARVDDLSAVTGRWPEAAARHGFTTSAGVPIFIEGALWGALIACASGDPLPVEIIAQLTDFAELTGTAVAAAQSRRQLRGLVEELTASRARVIATADETRRRIQRDVHDGAQQRLVHTIIALQQAQDRMQSGLDAMSLVAEARTHAELAIGELRDVVRGILPAALVRGGLGPGIDSLVADLPLPVDIHLDVARLPVALETTAYFVVAEALTNVVKHAQAGRVQVRVTLESSALVVEVRDDGVGGADPRHGTGLTGLLDRVAASNGLLAVSSSPGAGTAVTATLPVPTTNRRDSRTASP